MSMNLNMNDISEKWLSILKSSESLESFCQEHYGKSCRFFIGGDPKAPPTEDDAPFLMILTGEKEEWMETDNVYVMYVMGVIISEKKTKEDGVLRVCGQAEINDFVHIVLNELQDNVQYPMHAEVDVNPTTDYPQFSAFMKLTTTIQPAMGEELEY